MSDGGEYKQKVAACSVAAASVPSVYPPVLLVVSLLVDAARLCFLGGLLVF